MNKKSIIAIEKILNCINELEIICTGRDDNYFYDSYEMPILCDLVNEVEINLNKISTTVKRKYENVNWGVIDSYKEDDGEFKILKTGKVWGLASNVLKKELKQELSSILKIELPLYYTNYCNKQHERFTKSKETNNID